MQRRESAKREARRNEGRIGSRYFGYGKEVRHDAFDRIRIGALGRLGIAMASQIPEHDWMAGGDDGFDLSAPIFMSRAIGAREDDGRPGRAFGQMMLVIDRNSVIRPQQRHANNPLSNFNESRR
jgi:hypothetical protein